MENTIKGAYLNDFFFLFSFFPPYNHILNPFTDRRILTSWIFSSFFAQKATEIKQNLVFFFFLMGCNFFFFSGGMLAAEIISFMYICFFIFA